jgi:hypothetical protein
VFMINLFQAGVTGLAQASASQENANAEVCEKQKVSFTNKLVKGGVNVLTKVTEGAGIHPMVAQIGVKVACVGTTAIVGVGAVLLCPPAAGYIASGCAGVFTAIIAA